MEPHSSKVSRADYSPPPPPPPPSPPPHSYSPADNSPPPPPPPPCPPPHSYSPADYSPPPPPPPPCPPPHSYSCADYSPPHPARPPTPCCCPPPRPLPPQPPAPSHSSSRGDWNPRHHRPPPVAGSLSHKDREVVSIPIDLLENLRERMVDVDENLEPQAECCIYRVPCALRKKNEEAYTPKVIAIGPLHGREWKLRGMEKQKIRYKREFVKRITPEKWQQLINFIEENVKRIRNSYEENSKLEKLEFITMILYDAVFIIELFLKYYRQESDFLLNRLCLRETISSDLQLLENQLPFFVLDELYKSASYNTLGLANEDPSFISLSCVFFRHCKRGDKVSVRAEDILHFTDLSRYFMKRKYPNEYPKQGEQIKDFPCAAKLQASGVQFNGIEGESLLDIRFEKKKSLGISCLKVAELQIPQIDVDYYTESLMRNLMAFEQCHYPGEAVVCNYIDLMDKLIDTEEDVNLLAEAGIISNYLGEGARVADMFNDLCLEIHLLESNYSSIFKDLRDHYDNPWNHAKANLKRVYFTNIWRGTGTVAAIMLLLLTLIQAVCSVLQVV